MPSDEDDSPVMYLLVSDALALQNLVSLTTIYAKLKNSDADVKVLVVDACREVKGDKGDADDFDPPNPPKGIAAFYSCRTDSCCIPKSSVRSTGT